MWSKSWKYIFEIISELEKDKPNVVHLQHEMNMYGGSFTALMFPLLLILLKILGYRVVVTVHAIVYKKQIDKDFIQTFHQESPFATPFVIKAIFTYIFGVMCNVADSLIVHCHMTKDILVADYFAPAGKFNVFPTAIPQKFNYKVKKGKYFFYFGYMARRKGLDHFLVGFKKYIDKNPKSNFRLIMAGGVIKGQEIANNEILDIVKKLKLEDYVEYRGFIDMKEQDDLYRGAYAVIIPAKISMGSSGPLFHANSYGKCILTSKVGYFLEDIDHKKTGLLVPNSKWDVAIEDIVKNPKLVKSIEKSVIEKAKSRSPRKTAARYLKLYESLLNE